MTDAPSLIVLAGGHAKRLGRPKHSVRLGEETLLARVLRRAAPICGDRVIVARPGQNLGAIDGRVVRDEPTAQGALAGLAAGLAAIEREWALVLACDLPFVNVDLLRHLLTLRHGCDAVIPRLDVGDEPLHALYHKRCLPAIHLAMERGERRLCAFCGDVRVRHVLPETWRRYDPLGLSYFNINTEADLARARALIDAEDTD